MNGAASKAAERAARLSYGKLVALLAARSRDLAGAEDALSEALLRALQRWPVTGVPTNPEAWLLTVARRIELDRRRRTQGAVTLSTTLAILQEERHAAGTGALLDDRLKLLLVCAHPAIDCHSRAPLMLQAVLGLGLKRIASAFLVGPAAMGQRLSRAKAKIKAAGVRFEVPEQEVLRERVDSVLDAIYATYTVGWDSAFGPDGDVAHLAEEALWLARMLVELLPGHPEAKGLLALLLLCEARRNARRDPVTGRFVPLSDQDPARWSEPMVLEGERLVREGGRRGVLGRYQIEAAIQAVHADRRRTGRTDWSTITHLYAGLVLLSPSVGARIGEAVAVARTRGPAAALVLLDRLPPDLVRAHQPYWAARAHLLDRLGHRDDASRAYDRAIGLSEDAVVRLHLAELRGRVGGNAVPIGGPAN
jgi:RNA polymerase sigma-70 factor (ECF subfamily)